MLDKDDKILFLNKVIDNIKGYSIADLAVNRYVLEAQLDDLINKLLREYAQKRFEQLLKAGRIRLVQSEKFSTEITLSEDSGQEFNRNYYLKIDKLNKEEQKFIERLDLDTLPNIRFWIRNRERKDPFYLQGWQKNKFYPDFIAVTHKKNILALEWKGVDRISNEDTEYKVQVAKMWEKLGDGRLHFFLIHNGNIEEVLNKIKLL